MLDELSLGASDVVYDLGCGDARWLFAASARFGCQSVGIEIDTTLVTKATEESASLGLSELVKVWTCHRV